MIETANRLILTEIPAPGTEAWLQRLAAVEAHSMHGQLPIVWDDALDYSVWDIAKNKFIDFTSSMFVANVGHGNKAVLKAASDAKFLHSYTFATKARTEYLEALTRWSGFDKAFLVSSGTEATEAALRIMRAYGESVGKRRLGVVCLKGAFHGRTLGAQLMNLNAPEGVNDVNLYHLDPTTTESIEHRLQQLGNQRFLDFYLHTDLCGVMVETFEGWSARFHPASFIQELEAFCRQNDILLCYDEMQAGFGRTGRKFGFHHYLSVPDLICVGKAMGGGFPLSGVLGRHGVMDVFSPGDMSSTHGGNPLACVAGLATLREINRLDLVSEADQKGVMLERLCTELQDKSDGRIDTHGAGLIRALVIHDPQGTAIAKRIVKRCYEQGLLLVNTGKPSIKIGPPLTIPYDALLEGMSVVAEAVAKDLWDC